MISPDNRLSGRLQLPGFQSYGIGNFDNESEQEKEETDESGNFEADRAHHEPGNFFHVPESTKKTTTKRPKPTRQTLKYPLYQPILSFMPKEP